MKFLRRVLRDKRSATLGEHASIAAPVSLAALTVLKVLGTSVKNVFTTVDSNLSV